MDEKITTFVADGARDRDIVEFREAWDEPPGMHEKLEAPLGFETLIAGLSLKFINLPPHEVDPEIEDAQRRVCQSLGLDLSGLWQWSAGLPGSLELTHLYRSVEGPPTPEPMDAEDYFPWCLHQLLAGEVVAISSMAELPAEASRDRETWRQFGIKTTLTIPLSTGGGPLIGALSFNDVKEERSWPETLVKRLQLVAQIFANAIARKRSDQALQESEERLSLATTAAGVGVWMWDVSRNEVWASGDWRRIFGFPLNADIRYETVLERIHPQDRDSVHRAVQGAIESRTDYRGEYRVVLPDGALRWIAARGRYHPAGGNAQARMLGVSVDITDRKQAEAAMEERLRFEKLLADLSADFVNAPSEGLDQRIDRSLKVLVEFFGNDRCSVFEFAGDKRHALVTHSRTAFECEPFPVGSFPFDRLPWYLEQLCSGKPIFLRCLPEDLPLEAEAERRYCITHGIRSTIGIPLKAGGTILGALTFSFLQRCCQWPTEIISRLQMIGEVFANALLRRQSEETLRAALAENEALRSRLEQENLYLREQVVLKHHHGRIIGQSDALKRVLSEAERVASTDAPVLLLGETGTGKELLAQTIHEVSRRKGRAMVIVNCASLPATLIESELFGREAGAYTGAASAQIGRFMVADGSTLFLDEIGEFPVELQAKLLRVLQDGRFERLGSPETVTVNVRIIAATNRDLEHAVQEGKFRADLYHRLNVFPIHVPPLRERREDIPPLVWAFVDVFSRRIGKTIKSIPRKTFEQLQRYSWPGNVRELSNVIERAMILTTGDTLRVELPFGAQPAAAPRMTLKESERARILHVLQETGWRIRGAHGTAEILGIKPTTLEARMARLGIKRDKKSSNIS